jgi:hypothetical protein
MKKITQKEYSYIIIAINILIVLLLMVHLTSATTPIDQLVYRNESRQVINLNNLDCISALNIDQLNRELVKTPKWEMADLGYYYGYTININQQLGDMDTEAIKKFLNSTDNLPGSVGNNPDVDYYEITDTSQIPYY